MNPKHYHRPLTLVEAIERAVHPDTVAIAGGALLFDELDPPFETFVDLQDIIGLRVVEAINDNLFIGGTATLQQVVEAPDVPPLLKQALLRVLTPHQRAGATVGESLIVPDRGASPLREWLAALLALDARLEHAGNVQNHVQETLWEQNLEDFIQFVHGRKRPFRGIVAHVRIPLYPGRSLTGAAHVARTPTDAPIVNAAARVRLREDRRIHRALVVVGGASELPVVSLELPALYGGALTVDAVNDALAHTSAHFLPAGDYRGSAQYRAAMAQVCIQRALAECAAQI